MKKLIYGALLALGFAVGYGIYLFEKRPPDTRAEKAFFEVTAVDLALEFSSDEAAASKKYVDQVLIVAGVVNEVISTPTEASVILSTDDPLMGVTCSFYADEISSLKNTTHGMRIKIKGKCTGKLMDVVLNNCSLVN